MTEGKLRVRIVLVGTSHPGNVGAVARAMKTMGFGDLVLAEPRFDDLLTRPEATAFASHATDVLANAQVLPSLAQALADVRLALALTPRALDIGPPALPLRQAMEWAVGQTGRVAAQAPHFPSAESLGSESPGGESSGGEETQRLGGEGERDSLTEGDSLRERGSLRDEKNESASFEEWESLSFESAEASGLVGEECPPVDLALVFGSERSGLQNAQIARCHASVFIPADPEHASLNLAQAVQLAVYELRQALHAGQTLQPPSSVALKADPREQPATLAALEGLLAHWQQAQVAVGFLDPSAPKRLSDRIRALMLRAQPSQAEVDLLRGQCAAMIDTALRAGPRAQPGRLLPAFWMRGGSSKGLFLDGRLLPEAGPQRDALLCRVLGSPDPWGRQIDGVGGASSSASKVVLVWPSDLPRVDAEYLFGQVALDRASIDWSPRFDDLITAVAPFVLHQGWVRPAAGPDGRQELRLRPRNSNEVVVARVPLIDGRPQEDGDFTDDGVPFAAAIELEVHADDLTVLPTDHAVEGLEPPETVRVAFSLTTAGNATIETAGNATIETAGNATIKAVDNAAAMRLGLTPTREPAPNSITRSARRLFVGAVPWPLLS